MQKRSHSLLASSFMESYHGFSARRYEWAFLFGSVEPDCNPLSYLKGSVRVRALRGHNFDNAQGFVARRIARLQRCTHWGLWQYYTLGKLTHYLADGFLYPHNDHYPDSLMDHRRYENAFRLYFKDYLATTVLPPLVVGQNVAQAIDQLHRKYMEKASEMQRDATYIVQATALLLGGCLPPAEGEALSQCP